MFSNNCNHRETLQLFIALICQHKKRYENRKEDLQVSETKLCNGASASTHLVVNIQKKINSRVIYSQWQHTNEKTTKGRVKICLKHFKFQNNHFKTNSSFSNISQAVTSKTVAPSKKRRIKRKKAIQQYYLNKMKNIEHLNNYTAVYFISSNHVCFTLIATPK